MLRPGKGAAIDHGAAERGAVAAHEFGERMNDDVGAMIHGAHQHGRRHRVVDDQRHAVTMGDRGECLEVADVAGRIADRLAEHRAGVLVDLGLDVGGTVRFGEPDLHALFGQDVSEQRVGRAVELWHGDDIASHFGDVDGGVVERRLPRGCAERPDAALELRHPLLEHRGGGIADARVSESLDLEIEERGGMLCAVEGIGGGLIDRNRHRVGGRVRVESAVNRDRLFFHARNR